MTSGCVRTNGLGDTDTDAFTEGCQGLTYFTVTAEKKFEEILNFSVALLEMDVWTNKGLQESAACSLSHDGNTILLQD